MAAIGTAISAPMMPRSEPPINVATMVSPGVTFTVCLLTAAQVVPYPRILGRTNRTDEAY